MNILILGSGAFGTAIGNELASNPENIVYFLQRDPNKHKELEVFKTNQKYFPNKKLNTHLRSSLDPEIARQCDLIFIAVPTKFISA